MAKVIEFYVPDRFRKKMKWVPLEQRGKSARVSGTRQERRPERAAAQNQRPAHECVRLGVVAVGVADNSAARADGFRLFGTQTFGARLVDAERLLVHEIAGGGVARARHPMQTLRNSQQPHFPFKLEVSRNSWKTSEFSQMSEKVCLRRSPAMTGKYPHG